MSNARNLANLLGTGTQIKTDKVADEVFQANDSLIINGDCAVDQRNTTTTYSNTGGFGMADRFSYRRGGTWTTTTFDISQENTTGLNDFPKCNQVQVKDAVAAPNANDDTWCSIAYKFEGNELQGLQWGTSSAKAITLSFYVKSSVDGTYCVGFYARDDNRSYMAEYTIDTADTWEYKTITVPAPTTSDVDTKFPNDNTSAFEIYFIMSGNTTGTSSFRGSTGWNDSQVYHTANQANAFATLDNTFQMTAVKLEVGDTATPFQHLSYAENLQQCRRYYYRFTATSTYPAFELASAYQSSAVRSIFNYPVKMRDKPTYALDGSWRAFDDGSHSVTSSTISTNESNDEAASLTFYCSGVTVGNCYIVSVNNDTDAYLELNAEL